MTFNDICSETQFLLGYSKDTNFAIYTKEQIARHSNMALDELTSMILRLDGSWQWDDRNHDDLPIATTDLVSGQGQYTIDVDHMEIHRLEITDEDGKKHVLKSIDESNIETSIDEFESTNGTPIYFDKIAESIFLYPKPDYDLTNGMKMWFSRTASYFDENDTTKEPGFAKMFHEFIPVWNANKYAQSQPDMNDRYNKTQNRLEEIRARIKNYYSNRRRKKRIKVATVNRY